MKNEKALRINFRLFEKNKSKTHCACYYLILGCAFSLFTITTFAQDLRFSLEIANPNPVGSGARALGIGNTFIAVADDATAASWNPAGLMQLQHPEFSFAFEAISQFSEINSTTHRESETQNSLNLEDFNYASVILPFYLGTNMVFSLNYLKLFRFDNEMRLPVFDTATTENGVDTIDFLYDFDQHGGFSVLAPAFGISVSKKLSLGITFNSHFRFQIMAKMRK